MNVFPSPLHPAVVHFPIVLILIGTVIAIVAIVTARWHLRWIVAALLVLGASGTAVAVSTGDGEGESVEHAPGVASLLDAHEDWAERTEVAALVAAALAIGAVAASRWPAVSRGASSACAIAAMVASVCVYQTAHRGGQLVYRHAAGVNLASANAAGTANETAPVTTPKVNSSRRERDDD